MVGETKRLHRLEYIDSIIQKTIDRKLLRLLNKVWWREYFKEEHGADKEETDELE